MVPKTKSQQGHGFSLPDLGPEKKFRFYENIPLIILRNEQLSRVVVPGTVLEASRCDRGGA